MESFQEHIEKYKISIALCLVGLVLIIGGLSITPRVENSFPVESLVQTSDTEIIVDISGAVQSPGVYTLVDGAIIDDAIILAGGLLNTANKEYISKYLNKAQKISNGTKIYIPFESEKSFNYDVGSIAGSSTTKKININTSSSSQLETLSGIGPVTAEKIISGRPYQTLEELVSKKIIGKSTFEKIKDQLALY